MPFNHIAVLACGHTITTAHASNLPAVGEPYYCRKCAARKLCAIVPTEYSWRCRKCAGGRQYGCAYYTTLRAADKHRTKFPTHAVRIMHGTVIIEEMPARIVTVPLPTLFDDGVTSSLPDEPPF